jgi:large subunit ribosomal protein L10
MTRADKEALVSEMTSEFSKASALIVCDYKGLTCKELETVRISANESDAKVKVVKNTLASIALENAGADKLEIKNTNLIIWGSDQISTCKIADIAATNFKNRFVIKSGLFEGKKQDIATINAMAKLPTRDELLGMLLNVWNAPIQNFTIGLSALATKKEEEA